ncbi:hypothetical protein EJB05_46202, partial [Eragrostis curvula]
MTTALELNRIPCRPRVGCSCSHGDAIKSEREVQDNAVAGLFLEAIALLPIDDMPELLRCVVCGGASFGLLDPVSNIVLSAVSLLDRLERPPPEELARRAARTVQEQQCEESRNRIYDHIDMGFVQRIGLRYVSTRSVKGLAVFLVNYFRYLTEDQAARYIELAGYDLAVAIMLVNQDRFAESSDDPSSLNNFPDPSSNKTHVALKQAACQARLQAPVDDFVLLATSVYPLELLKKATARLLRKEKLKQSDINRMLRLMRWRSDDVPDKDDPNLAHLIVLRNPEEMAAMVKNCLESAPSIAPTGSPSNNPIPHPSSSSICQYHRGLKMQLLNTIHVFYLQALAKLPSQFLTKHLRGILKGGHCFGPLDPVSNIILNAIWYDLTFPLEDGEEKEPADVLDNRCFLRMERRSLDGLIALFAGFLGVSPEDSVLNEQQALEYLCSKNCDMSADLYGVSLETRTQYFTCAATAGRHPECAHLGVFHANLEQQEIESCMYLLSAEQSIPCCAMEKLYSIVRSFTQIRATECAINTLSEQAWKVLAEAKSNFRMFQSFFRKMIDLMLHDYNSSHTEEPIYKLHVVCGVTESISCYGVRCYHVNFLVRPKCESSGSMLFFSEFFASCTRNEENRMTFIHHKERPFFCCPVLMSSDLGRCSHCEIIASKVVHPVSGKYSSSDDLNSLVHLEEYKIDVDMELGTDFIYFDIKRDDHLARFLNKIGQNKNDHLQ